MVEEMYKRKLNKRKVGSQNFVCASVCLSVPLFGVDWAPRNVQSLKFQKLPPHLSGSAFQIVSRMIWRTYGSKVGFWLPLCQRAFPDIAQNRSQVRTLPVVIFVRTPFFGPGSIPTVGVLCQWTRICPASKMRRGTAQTDAV